MSGVSLRKVQELMGHKTIAMTCRYAHLTPEYLQDAVCKLDGWGQRQNGNMDSMPETGTESKTETRAFSDKRPTSEESEQAVTIQ